MIDKQRIKEMAFERGADLCGVASLDRFAEAPPGFHPGDVFPDCRSVVVLASRFPHGALKAGIKSPYTFVRNMMVDKLDRISFGITDELDRLGIGAVPIPSADPYDYWDADRKHGRGALSLKHAGHLAGLGVLGRNTLLLNDTYGNMIWLGAVLVAAHLTPDPIPADTICPDDCSLCLDACPQGALDGLTINQKQCRSRSITSTEGGGWVLSCFICRKVCPQGRGKV